MSYGAPQYSYAEEVELAYAFTQGVVPVAAAGNDRDTQLPDGTTNPVMYPAALPHIVSVAAMGPSGATSAVLHLQRRRRPRRARRVRARRRPAGVRRRRAQGRLRAARRHELRLTRSWPASRPGCAPARPDLTDGQIADLMRFTAADIGGQGWDEDSGYGLVNVRSRAHGVRARAGRARGQRRHLLGRRPPLQQARPVLLPCARPPALAARRPSTTGRTTPTSTACSSRARRTLKLKLTMPRGTNPDLAVSQQAREDDLQEARTLGWSYNKRGQDRAHDRAQQVAARTKVAYAVVYSPTEEGRPLRRAVPLVVKR